MKTIKILIIAVIVILIIAIISIYFILNSTTIYNGVKIEEVDLKGYNRQEALEKIQALKQKELENKQLKLTYKDYYYDARYVDLGITYDYYEAVNKAYQIGRQGSIIDRLKEIYYTRIYGKEIKMTVKYDRDKLYKLVNKISKDLNQESKNATISFNKGKFKIQPEVMGRKVKIDLLEKRIKDSILLSSEVEIPIQETKPRLTKENLSKIKDKLGEYTTSFYGSSQGRVHNIQLSSQAIDGIVLLPGELFSFNETTGARSKSDGYRTAKVIINGKFVDAIGGGVCQVSTTLYNAVLLSDLEIVERYHHSIPSTYVPKGRDATVVYGYLDLKFKNNKKYPVYIHTETANRKLLISIYGKKDDKNKKIDIKSVITEKISPDQEIKEDANLKPGEKVIVQKGRYGYKVKTYKSTIKDGKVVETELVSYDLYKPKKQIIKTGPKEENLENEEVNIE
ncbi:VanW family protein [Caldisalinibacter kiritimatiensis]|uniref:Vancomycin B-type resistance protein VanW n=1 Tax=Caldisalinibacter kiritimatiensis TaxID=1304284 RepID=R1ATF2_9FIRM|nr:VanW family protein [Caldisalinibacter kiritimatiensis]EOC99906.1 Vancomycin B-type resistance protein VanW [Caldisalinibacter kiritimatiensis]